MLSEPLCGASSQRSVLSDCRRRARARLAVELRCEVRQSRPAKRGAESGAGVKTIKTFTSVAALGYVGFVVHAAHSGCALLDCALPLVEPLRASVRPDRGWVEVVPAVWAAVGDFVGYRVVLG